MRSEERVAEILGDWRERRDRGEYLAPAEVIAAHPEVADELRLRFEAMALADRFFGSKRSARASAPTLAGYRIVRELGRGGMGVVYEAEQQAMRRRVALKVLYPSVTSTSQSVQRFQREAWAAGRLKHTNIAAVYELDQEGGTWFAAMELVEGRPLSEVLADLRAAGVAPRESRLARRALGRKRDTESWTGTPTGTRAYYVRVAEMFAEIAEALQVAHDHGVVHRDVKPANLILAPVGRLKLVDFGLARLDEDENAMTRTGDMVGTPLYMSPEQLGAHGGRVDHRTDIYSLGATLYEALALRPPHRAGNLQQIVARIVSSEAPSPRRWSRGIPRDLESIVRKAIAHDPKDRYRRAGDLARDLGLFAAGETIRARRVGFATRALRYARRHKLRCTLAGAAVICLVGLVIVAELAERQAERLVRRNRQLRDAAAHRYIAYALHRQHRLDEALPHARAAFEIEDPLADPHLYAVVTDCLLFAGRWRELAAAVERGHAAGFSNPGCEAVLWSLADEAELRDPDRALAAAQACKEENTDGDIAVTALGAALLANGDYEKAATILARALTRVRVVDLEVLQAEAHARMGQRRLAGLLGAVIEESLAARGGELRVSGYLSATWKGLEPAIESVRTEKPRGRLAAKELAKAAAAQLQSGDTSRAVAFAKQALVFDRSARGAWKVLDCAIRASEPSVVLEALGRGGVEVLAHVAVACNNAPEYDLACRVAELGLTEAPESAQLHYVRAYALRASRQPGKAVDLLERAFADHEHLREEFRLNAECGLSRLMVGDLEGACESMECALAIDPVDPSYSKTLWEQLLLARGQLGDFEKTWRAAEGACAAYPANVSFMAHRAVALNNLGRWDEAIRVAADALAIAPADPHLHYARAFALRKSGQPAKAVRFLERAFSDNEQLRDEFYPNAECGLSRLMVGDLEGGCESLERALQIDPLGGPYAEVVWQRLIRARGKLGDVEGALKAAESACAAYPASVTMMKERAVLLNNLGRADEAAPVAAAALKIAPDDPHLIYILAFAYGAEGREQDALDLVAEFVRRCPQHANYRPFVQLRFSALNDLRRYRAAFKLMLEYVDRAGEGRAGTALLQTFALCLANCPETKLRDPERALGIARKLVQRSGTGRIVKSITRLTLGIAEYRVGDYAEAVETLESALGVAPDRDAIAKLFLAMARHRLGDPEARASYDEAVRWIEAQEPDDAELARFRAEARAVLGIED
jgi:serine/threonine protein kinase/predicted Zn-dependent protease